MEWNAANTRDFRKRLGLTLREFAILLGLGQSTVEFLEAGRPFGSRVARKLSTALTELENGSLDLAWVQQWRNGPRANRVTAAKRPRVLRQVQRAPKVGKPLRAYLDFTLVPRHKQARLHRRLASLQIYDLSALDGLFTHVRASIASYLKALPAREGQTPTPTPQPSTGSSVSYQPRGPLPPARPMAL